METKVTCEEDIYDVLVVGAGPCGLSIAARLREHTPAALFTDEEHRRFHWIGKYGKKVALRHVKSGKISNAQTARPEYKMLVLDATAGTWMGRWNKLFKMYDISHLRSPMLWHVDPQDRDALLSHAYSNEREDELVEIRNCVGKELSKHAKKKSVGHHRACGGKQAARITINLRERNDYYTPSTSLFCDHCEKVADRYKLGPEIIRKESLEHIDYGVVKGISIDDEKLFTITSNQVRRYARTVVLAVGPANVAKIPRIPSMPNVETLPQTCHSMHIERFPDPVVLERIKARRSTNILVVGGGLTSAQLSDLAIRRGVTKVWHIMRAPMLIKHFDVDLEWMGKYKNAEQARFWTADTDDERLEIIKEARGGGSITPLFHKRLKKHIATQKLELHTETSLVDARFDDNNGNGKWTVQTNPPIEGLPAMDYIYFATGIQTDFSSLPYLQTMLEKYPIEGRGGFPCVNEDLMWNDDVPLFMMGRMAALQLGPAAPNLGGAKVGAERIAWAIEELVPRPGSQDDDGRNDPQASGMAGYLSDPCFTIRGLRFARSHSPHSPVSEHGARLSPNGSASVASSKNNNTGKLSTGCLAWARTLSFINCRERREDNDRNLHADLQNEPFKWLAQAPRKLRRAAQHASRTCDGYRAAPVGSLSWDRLLRPPPSVTPATDMTELRSLAYFHHVVAPVLSGPFDASFWTHLVAQVTHHESAARHAVLAISSFFENFSATTCQTNDNPFAIRHYNQAIKRVVTSKAQDIDTVLVVCILFTCIEFLRGDAKAALNHTRHGVRVLNTAKTNSKLAAVFCHMGIFPLFFGGTISEFPVLDHAPKTAGAFQSIIEAQHNLDIYATRAVSLVRMSENYQTGIVPNDVPSPSMLTEQHHLGIAFANWGKSFARFQATRSLDTNNDPASLALKIRWAVCKVWVRSCLKQGEMIYDEYEAEFESIINMARSLLLQLASTSLALAIPSTTHTPTPTSLVTLAERQPTAAEKATTTAIPTGYFITTKTVIIDGVTNDHVTIAAKTVLLSIPTCVQTLEPDENGYLPPGTCNAIWNYYPSFAAALVFMGLFAIMTAVHIWQAAKYKKRWCWVIIMAGLWETFAFLFRALSTKDPQNEGIYLVFQIFILLAPLWVNAFAYMTLGRMVYFFIPSQSIFRIPAVILAAIFVGLDIISFVIQLVGGSLAGPGSPPDDQLRAVHIYMGGIGLQEFFIIIFVGLCIAFQRAMSKLDRQNKKSVGIIRSPWGVLLCTLYFSLSMITIRIIYRLIEFSGGMGQNNALTTHEAYFYALEAVPMVFAIGAFNVIHPGKIMTGSRSEMPGLIRLLRNWISEKRGRHLLDNASDDGVELAPAWQKTRTSIH
ncbi:hypothetical protein G7Z17_g12455 [Cylindrodendrum hubeiense]|uniref:FAD/NAD(P)-binding domain-containing protein n=1 Tax=Cylindrodendrum hubeiense TaxID=595255 RepID=A0A9P5LAL5_9HYPO|nr:hypothetical protein G7Z17_g12455 [Cylindrodendrum hubeiense]